MICTEILGLLIRAWVFKSNGSDDTSNTLFTEILLCYKCQDLFWGLMVSSSSNLYFARVIPSIQTALLSIGALEFKNLQYTFKNLLQPIYKMQGTFTNI